MISRWNGRMYEMQQILEHGAKPVLDERRLLSLASGTDIVNPQEIARIIYEQYQIESPLERAVYLHCNIARTQPFADCNKRTSRLVEAVELMAAGLVPCYSALPTDVIAYRNAIIHYYETEEYGEYVDYFLSKLEGRIE